MMNKSQQSLTKIQHMPAEDQHQIRRNRQPSGKSQRKSGGHGDSGSHTGSRDQWDFFIPSLALFRRSSLILITALGRNYSNKFHVRDLARSLHYDVSMISKNLKQLEEVGLVTHEDVGNLVFYQANMKSVLLRHLKICLTLLELTDLIRALDRVTTNSILYGSCAKGEDMYESDIDLFLETHDKEAVQKILARHQRKLTREMSPIISTPDETYRLKTKDKTLFNNIQQGILLKG
jgi:predicted nucleotidyltransferase